ncbi:hypothetical protein ES708_25095 [subsurface metagenome]
MKIYYNPKLKELARQLRNDSTKSEIRLWKYLKGKQMMGYDFHRQKPIDNYIVDFFCNKLALAIELDGFSHSIEEVYLKDNRKEKRLKELGITVLRFQDYEVMYDLDNVIAVIQQYVEDFDKRHTPNPS